MCEDLWIGLEELIQVVRVAREVRRQHLHAGVGIELMNLADRLRIKPGALVGKIIATDAGDRRVAKTHLSHRIATRTGSPASKSAGLPVSIWQKSQRLVHTSPPIRKVASRSSQHSKMFGHPASWQTVCNPWLLTSSCSSRYCGPIRAVVLIHGGFFSIGVLALRTSRRNGLRPSGAMVTRSAYLGRWCPGRARYRRICEETHIPHVTSRRRKISNEPITTSVRRTDQ